MYDPSWGGQLADNSVNIIVRAPIGKCRKNRELINQNGIKDPCALLIISSMIVLYLEYSKAYANHLSQSMSLLLLNVAESWRYGLRAFAGMLMRRRQRMSDEQVCQLIIIFGGVLRVEQHYLGRLDRTGGEDPRGES